MPVTHRSPADPKYEEDLMLHIFSPEISDNLRNFVQFVFPWGDPNTPLARYKEPRRWQIEELEKITDHIKSNKLRMELGLSPEVYYSATASGRGVGKSAFTSMVNIWNESCHIGATTIVTANSETQLKTKTWAELGRWHTMAINSHWFEKTTMALRPQPWWKDHVETQLKIDTGYYYSEAQLWSAERPDAWAGPHNPHGLVVIFDEASGIPEPIWEVTKGFFTEPELHRYWFAFSNPRRNSGGFFECFHLNRKYWHTRNLDARTVEENDQAVYQQIIDQHGEDSDAARVEVKGQFPRQGDRQFISRELVQEATQRPLVTDKYAPLILGIDPARYGDDETVMMFRQGRDARSFPITVMKQKDNVEVADMVALLINEWNPDAVNIDAGAGHGIIDILKHAGYKVREVQFGAAGDHDQFGNNRTHLWGKMRDWLKGGCINATQKNLIDDLPGPEYRYQLKTDKIILEPKESMKDRGIASPNHADALAITFDGNPAPKNLFASRHSNLKKRRMASGMDDNILD